ncbi:MAG: hypothetical protein MK207_08030 [Saprospiraceae bacterium]|nr:hypothetical protein [Saprospiraceae bacterium]
MLKKHFFSYKTIIFLFIVIGGFSCDRVFESLVPANFEYFPLETGKYKTYQIDSIVYDEYNCIIVQSTYQVKEVTSDLRTDGEGDPFYSVRRFIRKDSTEEWELYGVWSEKIEDNQVQRVEDNQRMIKMVLPVVENTRWDGIVYIRRDTLVPIRGGSIDMFKDWDDFIYENVGELFVDTISNNIYPDAVQVLQVDKTNNIERRFSREVYAKNIGLVYKEMWILDTQCRPPGTCTGVGDISTCLFTPWEIKAEKGFILTQSLIDYN